MNFLTILFALAALTNLSFAESPKLKKFCDGLEQEIEFREEKVELVQKQLKEIEIKIKNLQANHEDASDEIAHRKFIHQTLHSLTAKASDECVVSSVSDVNKPLWKGCGVSCLEKAQETCKATLAAQENSDFKGKRAIGSEQHH